jgi:hypothetical protein
MSSTGIDSVVGNRGLFMFRIASLCLLQRMKGSMSGDARDFNNIETPTVIKFFSPFSPARQGAEGNSRHSDRNSLYNPYMASCKCKTRMRQGTSYLRTLSKGIRTAVCLFYINDKRRYAEVRHHATLQPTWRFGLLKRPWYCTWVSTPLRLPQVLVCEFIKPYHQRSPWKRCVKFKRQTGRRNLP